MSPSDRPVFDLPEFTALQVRLAVALVLSFTVHLSLIYLLPVRPPSHAPAAPVLQVTLEEGRLTATRQVTEVPPVLAAVPEAAAVTVSRPRQQAASTLPDVDLAKPAAPPDAAETLPVPAAAPALALELPLAEDPVYYTARELDRHPAAAHDKRGQIYLSRSCWFILTKYCTIKPLRIEGMKVQNMSCGSARRLLRVAASSNPAVEGTLRDEAAQRPSLPR